MDKIVKTVLAILFFLCLFHLPYGFYQAMRFSALIGFALLAYWANENNNRNEMIVYASLAILFQPLFKIALGRDVWNIVDIIVGVGLIVSIFFNSKISKKP